MFIINYRIVDDIDFWNSIDSKALDGEGDIEGFFQLIFNNGKYGYYHSNPLVDGEEGFFLLRIWISMLLKVLLTIQKNGYAAFRDIETPNVWIEFIYKDKTIKVREIISNISENYFTNNKIKELEIRQNLGIVDIKEFAGEIILKSKYFIKKLTNINESFRKNKKIIDIQCNIKSLEDDYKFD